MTLYEAPDYRAVLDEKIQENKGIRGYLRLLAKAAGCHPSFLSQVRRGSVQLTPDQAAGLCRAWEFSDDETEWFLTMVQLERAGSPALKAHLTNRLRALQEKRTRLSRRLKTDVTIPIEHQVRYYASWHLSALHVLASIPAFQTPSAMAARLGIPETVVLAGLAELETTGLIRREAPGRITSVPGRNVHVPGDSPLNWSYHATWRHNAITRAPVSGSEGLHYTAVYALSDTDFLKLRELLMKAIEATRALVLPSQEETAGCLLIDWYKV